MKKTMIFLIVIAVLVVMSIEYTMLATDVNIVSDAKVAGHTWDVYFDNLNDISNFDSISLDLNHKTKVNLSLNIEPNQTKEFRVNANNRGTLNAYIKSITLNFNDYDDSLNYEVLNTDGSEVLEGQNLYMYSTDTYIVKIKYDGENIGNINLSTNFIIEYGTGSTELPSKVSLIGEIYNGNNGNKALENGIIVIDNKETTFNNFNYKLKNLTLGNHTIIIKDENNIELASGNINIATGLMERIYENNIVLKSMYGTNLYLYYEDGNINYSFDMPDYTVNFEVEEDVLEETEITLKRYTDGEVEIVTTEEILGIACTNNQDITFDNETKKISIKNITRNSVCTLDMNSDEQSPIISYKSKTNDNTNENYANKDNEITITFEVSDDKNIKGNLVEEDIAVKVGDVTVILTTKTLTSSGTNPATYTLTTSGIIGNGSLSIVVDGAKISDKAGNKGELTVIVPDITIDNIAPALQIDDENIVEIISGEGTQVGDEIAIGDEHFYVISNDGTNITMLAKYNLLVGNSCTSNDSSSCTPIENPTGIQDESSIGWHYKPGTEIEEYPMIGGIPFSTSTYWGNVANGTYVYDNRASISTYINNYKTYLQSFGVNINEARLISIEELTDLGCYGTSDRSGTCQDAPSWVWSTTYWTGTAFNNEYIWTVDSQGSVGGYDEYSTDTYFGVRPVIVIPIKDLNAKRVTLNFTDENGLSEYLLQTPTETIDVPLSGTIYNEIGVGDGFDTNTYHLYVKDLAGNIGQTSYKINAIKKISGDGTHVGDEIAIGPEHFYVLSNDGTNITMFSKYNLLVGNKCNFDSTGCVALTRTSGIQDARAKGYDEANTIIGTVPFSSRAYWGNVSDVYVYDNRASISTYVNNYKNYLQNFGASITEARLISLEELRTLGCDSTANTCANAPSWVYSTTYWTGSAVCNDRVWDVTSVGGIGHYYYYAGDFRGVRPVIVIPADSI